MSKNTKIQNWFKKTFTNIPEFFLKKNLNEKIANNIINAIEKKASEDEIIKLCDSLFKNTIYQEQYLQMKNKKPKYETTNFCKNTSLATSKKKIFPQNESIKKSKSMKPKNMKKTLNEKIANNIIKAIEKKASEDEIIKLCDSLFNNTIYEEQYLQMKNKKPKYETTNFCKNTSLATAKKKFIKK